MSKDSSFILAFFSFPQPSWNAFSKCFSQGSWDKDILDTQLLAYLPVLGVLLALNIVFYSFLRRQNKICSFKLLQIASAPRALCNPWAALTPAGLIYIIIVLGLPLHFQISCFGKRFNSTIFLWPLSCILWVVFSWHMIIVIHFLILWHA